MCKGVKFRIVSDNFKASSGIDLPGDVAFRGGCIAGGAGYDERFASGNNEMVVIGNDDEGWLGTDEARLHSRASF